MQCEVSTENAEFDAVFESVENLQKHSSEKSYHKKVIENRVFYFYYCVQKFFRTFTPFG